MWISGIALMKQLEEWKGAAAEAQQERRSTQAEAERLHIENERLRSDLDWFKLRLNQVERERGQLIQAAIGVKIAVPEFVPTYENPEDALTEQPDFSLVGADAPADYGMMPDRTRN